MKEIYPINSLIKRAKIKRDFWGDIGVNLAIGVLVGLIVLILINHGRISTIPLSIISSYSAAFVIVIVSVMYFLRKRREDRYTRRALYNLFTMARPASKEEIDELNELEDREEPKPKT